MSPQGSWSDEVAKRLDSMVALRRDFHRHPELSFQETRTAEIIAERLTKAGLEVRTGIAKTGVVGILRGDKPGRTIAWRADIDALPLTEILAAPFTSGTPGVMHACGHDGHTAIAITWPPSTTASAPSSSTQQQRTISVSRSGLITGGQPIVRSSRASARYARAMSATKD